MIFESADMACQASGSSLGDSVVFRWHPRTHDAQRGLSQLQIEQTGAGSTVKYHGMYVAKDAVAQLAGTLPQRAVVPCFVRGARLRVCVRVSALRVCSA